MEDGPIYNQKNNAQRSRKLWRAKAKPPTAFLVKTFTVVDDPRTEEVISWNDNGTAFVVWRPEEFARDLLPTLFKHCNFSSFIRQLNTYGFRKVATDRWEFCNMMFRQGKPELLCKIRRRRTAVPAKYKRKEQTEVGETTKYPIKNLSAFSSSPPSSSFDVLGSLISENSRLMKENGVLRYELTTMNRRCKELLDLVAMYSMESSSNDRKDDDDSAKLQLGPKLFGVRLEVEAGEPETKKKAVQSRSLITVSLSQTFKR